jgi:hypothetical protein
LPTARNLPFQFSVGSHSSTLMFESDVGFSTSVTRQCCGIGCGGGPDCACGLAGAFGGLNKPEATSTALVIVARSSSMFLSSAHGMFSAPDAAMTIASMAPPSRRRLNAVSVDASLATLAPLELAGQAPPNAA